MSTFWLAEAEDIPALGAALRDLGAGLNDPYIMPDSALGAALMEPDPAGYAVCAGARDALTGAALFSPLISTSYGATGAFISDLWVAPSGRSSGLGPRLIAEVLRHGGQLWGAAYIRLAVYDDNPRAMAFYERMGFVRKTPREHGMILPPDAAAKLVETI